MPESERPSLVPAVVAPVLPALPGFARVSAIPNCLAPHKRWTGRVPALISLERAVGAVCDLARVPRMLRGGGVLWLNGIKIPREFWGCLHLADGDELEFIIRPFGGGGGFFNSLLKIVGAVVGIAISIWAPFTTPFWGPLLTGVLAMGATVGISLLADLIAPVRPPSLSSPSLDQRSASPTYSLNASSNSMSFGAPVRKVYGRHLVPLTRIVDDYTELIGADEYFYFLGVVGFGPLSMEGMQLGDTALDLYQDVSIQICNGRPGDAVPDILPTVVYQTPLSIQLLTSDSVGNPLAPDAWWVTRSTEPGVDRIGFDVQAPQGLFGMDDNANRYPVSRSVEYRYRKKAGLTEPAGEWQGASQTVKAQTVSFPQAILPQYSYSYYVSYDEGYRSAVIPAVSFTATCYLYLDSYGTLCQAQFSAKNGTPYRDSNGWHGSAQVSNPSLPSTATLICTIVISAAAITSFELGEAAQEAGITVEQAGPLSLTFSEGSVSTVYSQITLSGYGASPDKAVRKGVSLSVPFSDTGYDIQWRPTGRGSNSSRTVDALYISAIRAADTTKKPYVGDIPLAMVGMRIKATNQIQNSLPLFTLIATAELPDWDKESQTWIERPTRSPAAAYLDVLRGRANFRPRPDAEIHFESIQAWSEWCAEYGYYFDAVYDTQTKVWDALADIAAAGRGSPCLIDGKWGVVWQRKQPGQAAGHVTVRNSRDFSSSRSYKDLIHGLRISFINEEQRYEQDELTVYAPGYNAENATLFEKIELFGTTNPAQAAIKGQWHLNEALLLIEQYSATMPLEYLRLRKGQKVRVVRPEVLYGIGTGAVKGWTLDDNGDMTSLTWDTELQLTPGERYGAVVRLIDGSEWTVAGTSEDGRILRLEEPLPPPLSGRVDDDGNPILLIRRNDIVMVGTAGDVGRMCLVTGIRPGDNLTATVSFVDYIDELYENDGGPIPDYTPSITLPGTGPLRKAKTPRILSIRSDEWALAALPGGGSQPRIYLEWQFTDDSRSAQVQFRRHGAEDGAWQNAAALTVGGVSCYIDGVLEGFTVTDGVKQTNGISYDVRVRAVNNIGWSSDWAIVSGHVVIGRTTPPPAPDMVYLDGYAARIRLENRPLDVVGFEFLVAFDPTDSLDMALPVTHPYTSDAMFDLRPWAGNARRVFVRTVDELGLTSAPRDLLIDFGDILPENVVLEYSQKAEGWPGEIVSGAVGQLDRLYASDSTYIFPTDPQAYVFADEGRLPVFPTANGAPMSYSFRLDVPRSAAGARVLVQADLITGGMQSIEFRHYVIPYVFPDTPEAFVFPADAERLVFPVVVSGQWQAMPSDYVTPGGEWLDIRITFRPGEFPAIVDDIRAILDVKDQEAKVDSLLIPASGARLPIPAGVFRVITTVTYGMEAAEGLTAVHPLTLDKNGGQRDEAGYLLEGPLVVGIDRNDNYTAVQIDAVIKGY